MKKLTLVLVLALCLLLLTPAWASASTPTLRSLAKTVAALKTKVNSQGRSITSLKARLATAEQTIAAQGTTLTGQAATIASLSGDMSTTKQTLTTAAPVLALAPYVSVTSSAMNGVVGPNIVFQGANVHVRDGSGATNCNPGNVNTSGTMTGLGNLIIGYDESYPGLLPAERAGSNNLILGIYNRFLGAGCFVDGRYNRVSTQYAAVSGGVGNTASAEGAAVSGGTSNTASAAWSSVSGGIYNVASFYEASVSGGWQNTASGQYSSVSGGYNNLASGSCASISGGSTNTVSTQYGWAP